MCVIKEHGGEGGICLVRQAQVRWLEQPLSHRSSGFGSGNAPGIPVQIHLHKQVKKTYLKAGLFYLAEREGFEPSMELPPYRLSKTAH